MISPNEIDEVIKEGQFYGLVPEKEEMLRKNKLLRFCEDGFIEIIANISGSLCKLLKSTKS